MRHDPPSQEVATTFRATTLLLSPTTYTNAPFRPCCTARCGTRMALGRLRPSSRTRTNCPGSRTCCGFLSCARSCCVPVAGCSAKSAKFSAPGAARDLGPHEGVLVVFPRLIDGRLRLVVCLLRVVHVLLGDGALGEQRLEPRQRTVRVGEPGLGAAVRGFVRRGIDPEQQCPLRDVSALGV